MTCHPVNQACVQPHSYSVLSHSLSDHVFNCLISLWVSRHSDSLYRHNAGACNPLQQLKPRSVIMGLTRHAVIMGLTR